jgi:hypothetical protein
MGRRAQPFSPLILAFHPPLILLATFDFGEQAGIFSGTVRSRYLLTTSTTASTAASGTRVSSVASIKTTTITTSSTLTKFTGSSVITTPVPRTLFISSIRPLKRTTITFVERRSVMSLERTVCAGRKTFPGFSDKRPTESRVAVFTDIRAAIFTKSRGAIVAKCRIIRMYKMVLQALSPPGFSVQLLIFARIIYVPSCRIFPKSFIETTLSRADSSIRVETAFRFLTISE